MQGFTRAMQLELYELLGIGPGSGSLELAMDTYGPWVGLMGHRGNDCGLVDDIGYSGHFFFFGTFEVNPSVGRCFIYTF